MHKNLNSHFGKMANPTRNQRSTIRISYNSKGPPMGCLVYCYGATKTINKASLPCPNYPISIQDIIDVKLEGKELVHHTMHEIGHVKSKFQIYDIPYPYSLPLVFYEIQVCIFIF